MEFYQTEYPWIDGGRSRYCRACWHSAVLAWKPQPPKPPRQKRNGRFKRCPKCQKHLGRDQFGRDASRKDGRAGYCRPCVSANQKARRFLRKIVTLA
jgi:hypothetical protein